VLEKANTKSTKELAAAQKQITSLKTRLKAVEKKPKEVTPPAIDNKMLNTLVTKSDLQEVLVMLTNAITQLESAQAQSDQQEALEPCQPAPFRSYPQQFYAGPQQFSYAQPPQPPQQFGFAQPPSRRSSEAYYIPAKQGVKRSAIEALVEHSASYAVPKRRR
jgi:hypothetical protein